MHLWPFNVPIYMEKRTYSNTHTTYMKILVTHAIVQVSTLILKKNLLNLNTEEGNTINGCEGQFLVFLHWKHGFENH